MIVFKNPQTKQEQPINCIMFNKIYKNISTCQDKMYISNNKDYRIIKREYFGDPVPYIFQDIEDFRNHLEIFKQVCV